MRKVKTVKSILHVHRLKISRVVVVGWIRATEWEPRETTTEYEESDANAMTTDTLLAPTQYLLQHPHAPDGTEVPEMHVDSKTWVFGANEIAKPMLRTNQKAAVSLQTKGHDPHACQCD